MQENYIEKNIEYVLLIGNPDPDDQFDENDSIGDVPMKWTFPLNKYQYITRTPMYASDIKPCPTDYYYSDLSGNWDIDGDLLYGEKKLYFDINQPPKPYSNINDTLFSVRLSGAIVKTKDSIWIKAYYNDGIKIWVNDTLLNSSNPNSRYYWSDTSSWSNHIWGMTGESNFFHDDTISIKIEFYQYTKDSWLKLSYKTHKNGIDSIIPAYWYKHYSDGNYLPKLIAEYYNNIDLTGDAEKIKQESTINKDWARGDRCFDLNDFSITGVDFYPEVIVGRIPVYNNIYYLDSILNRSINYQYSNNIIWRKNLLMSFDVNLDSCTYIIPEAIKRNCDLFDFNSYRIYSNYIETEDNDNLKVIQNGYFRTDTTCLIWRNIPFGIVTWLCHGNSRGASGVILSGQSGNQYASSLSDNYPSLIFQGACWNASPDDSLNLAYSLLKHQAVGTIAATRPANGVSKYDSVNISNGFETSHWNYWFTKLLMNNNISIGQTLINLKSQFPSSFDGQWVNILGFNLYGDPSLKLNSTVNTILLKNGWNFISSYLLPDRNSLKSMFWYIKNYIGSIKNQNDDVFIPDSIDEIGNWNNQKAYKIYMNTSAYFYIAGSKINPVLDTIPLNSGWNWVSYLRNSNMSIDTAYALNSIKNNLLMAKSGSGLIYVPEFHINQIGNMLPNQGYEISVNADCNLVYPQDSTSYNYKAVLDETSILSPVAKKLTPFVTNTGNDCTLIFDKLNIPDGYEIGIVNGDGILIGAGAIQNRVCALTVWGKDILNNTEVL